MKFTKITLTVLLAARPALCQDATPPAPVPAAAPAPADTGGVEVLLGVGSKILGNVSDYKTNGSNVLEAKNIGRATPQALVGLGFPGCSVGDSKQARAKAETMENTGITCKSFLQPLSAFVSATFSSDTNHTISSYTIGMGYHVSKNLHIIAGFSLSPVSEPSPGFRDTAANLVAKNQAAYPTFDPVKMRNNDVNAFDGFQFVTPPASGSGSGNPVYAGDVLATHYRGGLFIGVAFPLTLKSHFQ